MLIDMCIKQRFIIGACEAIGLQKFSFINLLNHRSSQRRFTHPPKYKSKDNEYISVKDEYLYNTYTYINGAYPQVRSSL